VNTPGSVGFCVDCRREMGSARNYRELGLIAHYSHGRCRRCHYNSLKPAIRRGDLDWQTRAACRRPGAQAEWWFPEPRDTVTARNAKRICAECPVREQCLADALATGDWDYGIRAGLGPDERRRLRRRRRAVAA
jgi:WhiB family redox-sensing transcriptional regulator